MRRTIKGKVHENHLQAPSMSRRSPRRATGEALLDGRVVTVRGNEMTVTYDSNGVPMGFQATITEQYPNISRARQCSETQAQRAAGRDGRTGVAHDERAGPGVRRWPRRRAPVLPRARPGQHVPAGEWLQPARVHAARERDGHLGERSAPTSTSRWTSRSRATAACSRRSPTPSTATSSNRCRIGSPSGSGTRMRMATRSSGSGSDFRQPRRASRTGPTADDRATRAQLAGSGRSGS